MRKGGEREKEGRFKKKRKEGRRKRGGKRKT